MHRPTGPRLALAGFSLAALLAVTGCSSEQPATDTSTLSGPTVATTLLSFEPESLTVSVGDTVTWQVSDSIAHTVTTGTFTLGGDGLRTEENPDGLIDVPLSRSQDATFTFDQTGTYSYYCSIHKGMSGEIVVQP